MLILTRRPGEALFIYTPLTQLIAPPNPQKSTI